MSETHGKIATGKNNPERVEHKHSLHQIFLIEFNFIFYQQSFKFVIECFFSVMLLLIFDIIDDHILFSDRISKCAVSLLPCFKLRELTICLHPPTAGNFYILYIIRKTNCWMEIRENM